MKSTTADLQSSVTRWLIRVLWVLALVGLVYLAGLTFWLGVTGIVFPYQLDYGEGFLLHFVKEWSQGHPIYKGAEGYPYIMANYPPLTILMALALTPILGISYAAGRVWTVVAIVGVAAIIVAWIRREGRQPLPAIAAALLFVGSPYIYHWAPLFRVDLVGLALTLAGLYAVWRGVESKRPRLLWLAVVLFVVALFAKQSFLFAPAAALAYLFLFVARRQAVTLAVVMAVLGGGIFLLLNALTGGGFWYGLVASNVNPFLWAEFWRQVGDFFGVFAPLALLTAGYVVVKFVLDRSTPLRDKASPLDLYLLASLGSLWFAGKAGAWENYFFEALVAFALCSGLVLARIARSEKQGYRILVPLLVLVQVGLMWHTSRPAERYLHLTRQSNEEIAPFLAQTPDPIVSEDMGLLVTNDKVLDYCSFQYSQLARAGRWDQAWELGRLRDRSLTMVILEEGTRLDADRYQRFTREFLSELDRSYRHTQTVGKYQLHEPDPLQHERRAEFGDQLTLVGWSLHAPPAPKQGDTVRLTIVWQTQQALATEYTAFAHLLDQEGQGWAGDDHPPRAGLYPTTAWGPGEMVRDTHTLIIPSDAPPGLYDIRVGWYPSTLPQAGSPASKERLPVGEENTFRVAVLPVDWQGTGSQAMIPLGRRFGEAITLESYAWHVDPVAIQLTLRWSADVYLHTDYTVFVHLVGSGQKGEALAQGDGPPLAGRWPTSLWLPGVSLDDIHTVSLPPDLPPGTYGLLVGLYDPSTGDRLTLPDGTDALRLDGISLP